MSTATTVINTITELRTNATERCISELNTMLGAVANASGEQRKQNAADASARLYAEFDACCGCGIMLYTIAEGYGSDNAHEFECETCRTSRLQLDAQDRIEATKAARANGTAYSNHSADCNCDKCREQRSDIPADRKLDNGQTYGEALNEAFSTGNFGGKADWNDIVECCECGNDTAKGDTYYCGTTDEYICNPCRDKRDGGDDDPSTTPATLSDVRDLFNTQRAGTLTDDQLSPLGRMAACVATSGTTTDDMYRVCIHCGKAQLYKAGVTYFTESKRSAKCDCDWRCCEHSAPGAQKHAPHFVMVPVASGYVPTEITRTFDGITRVVLRKNGEDTTVYESTSYVGANRVAWDLANEHGVTELSCNRNGDFVVDAGNDDGDDDDTVSIPDTKEIPAVDLCGGLKAHVVVDDDGARYPIQQVAVNIPKRGKNWVVATVDVPSDHPHNGRLDILLDGVVRVESKVAHRDGDGVRYSNCPRCGTLVRTTSIYNRDCGKGVTCGACKWATPDCKGNGCNGLNVCDLRNTRMCPESNRESGSTAILALVSVSSATILGMIHWPLVLVALAAVLVYKAMDDGGAPCGWYRMAPRAVDASTPSTGSAVSTASTTADSYRTANDNSPLALALLDVCEGGNHVAPTSGTITVVDSDPEASELPVSHSWYGFDRQLGSTLVAEVGVECAPNAQYPRVQVAALDSAIDGGLVLRLARKVAVEHKAGRIGNVERNTPTWASCWIQSRIDRENMLLVDVKVEQRRVSGRFTSGYQAVATVCDIDGNESKHRL